MAPNPKIKNIADQYSKLSDAEKIAFAQAVLPGAGKQNQPPADQWQALTMADAYKPQPPIRYTVNGLFEVGTLNILYGAPGSLKSFLMQDLAVCVAMGIPWLPPAPWGDGGQGIITTQTPVIWCDFDMGERRTLERFNALGKHYKAPEDLPLTIFSMPRPRLNAGDLVHIDLMIDRALALDAGFIVIDNLRTVSGGIDENSSQMSEIMEGLRELTERTSATVAPIHHERKSSGFKGRAGEALRGHSSIEASIDLALQVDREPYSDIIAVKSTKTRGLEVLPFSAAFTYSKNGSDELTEACFYGIQSEDNQSNKAIEREILESLNNNPMNQTSLTNAVKAKLSDVGLNRITNQIRLMENKKQIRVTTGAHNAKIYSIPVI
jgi:hypothetical protein